MQSIQKCGLEDCKVAKDIDIALLRSWKGGRIWYDSQNVNKYFYESEARRIAELNEIFGDIELTEAEMRMLIWLAGWDEYTIENVLSAIRKAIAAEVKRRQQPPRP